LDNLSTPSDLGHSLQKDKVRCKIIMSMWRNKKLAMCSLFVPYK
jgi:hypothetical protein